MSYTVKLKALKYVTLFIAACFPGAHYLCLIRSGLHEPAPPCVNALSMTTECGSTIFFSYFLWRSGEYILIFDEQINNKIMAYCEDEMGS